MKRVATTFSRPRASCEMEMFVMVRGKPNRLVNQRSACPVPLSRSLSWNSATRSISDLVGETVRQKEREIEGEKQSTFKNGKKIPKE